MIKSRPLCGSPAYRGLVALAVFIVLTIVHTWPLITDPAHLSGHDNADAKLVEWIISWVAHQVVQDPVHLFDANIFHPEPRALTFSEALIVPGVVGAPLRWLGASPVLTYNVLLMAGFVLTALGMYVLVHEITGDLWAALLAGSLIAFNARTLSRLPHLQIIFAASLPLSLWALERILGEPRQGDPAPGARARTWFGGETLSGAFWLALFVVLTAWTSIHLLVFALFALATVFVVRWRDWRGERAKPVLACIGVAAVLAATIGLSVLAPYLEAYSEGARHPLEGTLSGSASLGTYLSTPARLHYAVWSHAFYHDAEGSLFPGLVAGGLAVLGIAWGRRGVPTFLGILVVGFALSFGAALPGYSVLYRVILPLQAIRAPWRLGYLFLLAVAGLAAIGLTELRRRHPGKAWLAPVAVGLIVVANLEALHAPFSFRRFEGFPPIYERIAEETTPGALVELPVYRGRPASNADYVLASTLHWRPLVNGYSGVIPQSFRRNAEQLQRFPSRRSIRTMRQLGVTLVVFHTSRYRAPVAERKLRKLSKRPQLELVTVEEDGTRLYRLSPRGRRRALRGRIERRRPELELISTDDNGSYLYRLRRRQADR